MNGLWVILGLGAIGFAVWALTKEDQPKDTEGGFVGTFGISDMIRGSS